MISMSLALYSRGDRLLGFKDFDYPPLVIRTKRGKRFRLKRIESGQEIAVPKNSGRQMDDFYREV